MQQFTVPQFIDVEDKIIGPITTRQFLIMLVAAIIIAICYKIFDFELFAIIGLFILAISGIIAFLRINGQPFHFFILNFIQTLKKPGLRIWGLEEKKLLGEEFKVPDNIIPDRTKSQLAPFNYKYYNKSRLAELSLIVDTHGAYRGDGGMVIRE